MRVACIQMVSSTDVAENLRVAERLLREAAADGAHLALLPENFACYGRGYLREEGERESRGQGPILPFLQAQARHLGLWIVGGTIPLVHGDADADAGRIYAASCVWNAEGELVGRYDKIHLFDVQVGDAVGAYRESSHICPGSRARVVDSPWGKLGLAVCYDLRFPEYFRQLTEAGADILLVPSAFTHTTGEAHWEILLRARAIENQCFVLAANQGGWHTAKRRTWGDSMIVHPWGQVLARQKEGEGVVVAELDLNELRDIRKRMPVALHRKF